MEALGFHSAKDYLRQIKLINQTLPHLADTLPLSAAGQIGHGYKPLTLERQSPLPSKTPIQGIEQSGNLQQRKILKKTFFCPTAEIQIKNCYNKTNLKEVSRTVEKQSLKMYCKYVRLDIINDLCMITF